MTDLAPFDLAEDEDDPGHYSLILSDEDMGEVTDVFEEFDYYGNGYGWEGVARTVIARHAPEIADLVDYDPEAGMFEAHGDDREALERLGALLHKAFHDREFLAELLEAGDPEWFD
jgi:Immunity protein 51